MKLRTFRTRLWNRLTARAAAAAFSAALLFGAGGAVAPADVGEQNPDMMIAHIVDRNPALHSFEAHVHVALHMTSFPYLAPKLEGRSYFKRPNNYEVVFDKMPSYAKNFGKIYSDVGDPSDWNRRFVITVVGTHPFAGRADVELRMVQRVRGQIDHESVLVDPSVWAIDEIDYHYYNGGTIALTQNFHDVGGFSVLAEQHVDVAIPHVRAVGTAVYSDYHTNVAVDDSVFTKKP